MQPHRHRNVAEPHQAPPAYGYGPAPRERDPLTDSGVMRLRQTRVQLHLAGGAVVEVALLDIQGVYGWDDVALRIKSVQPIDVRGEHRYAFAAGVVLWAEIPPES